MTKINNPILLILLISFSLIFTCTNDNTITNSIDKTVAKPTENTDIYTTTTDDFREWFTDLSYHYHMPPIMFAYILSNKGLTENMCFFAYLIGITPENIDTFIPNTNSINRDDESKLYAFRDNFLTKSSKGKGYIACFYILSEYGIKNNLVNQYYKEHYDLLKNSIGIAHDMQYNSNNDQILIKKETANNLKDMLKIYRSSQNHRDIEPVLDYLQADLEKYYNKPKIEIVADFQEN